MIHPLAGYSAATISDALDRIGRPGALLGLAPIADGVRLCGRAFTVRYVPAGFPPGTVGDYLDDVGPGEVVVLDNGGRTDCTVWGDILTAMAADRGIGGTVIDGVCRDVQRALGAGYPLYSRGRFPRTGKDRVEVAEVGGPVGVGGVQVRPGDLLVGDADGIVAVPREVEDRIGEICAAITASEDAILADVLAGSSLAAARRRHGYHLLQRQEASR
ncbi:MULTISPECIES: RraA family protein [Pseudonocardia]|uniref:Putative 4-hydroxy-4-methyl-2-oxoglutarate aldolase n=2 Tax=Pseudonocardia TaxID=1847 RepID=A0A1Y2MYW8_PSEAH|nr:MULTISPECIES: diguanylate cyclase [Pseudonocardia]OSY40375.1 4-hydroxy-4-methyl-2-oxoglutarate aldolase [Pseudonocardia autotrophica]TDN72294.1 regulator of RNase E activity RraA [Pseudonocardia autotrophica]BBG03006.1 diguanylate cyclase [Pseudonocardia autotrophica]GEC25092.1 diguanylate cyclase [Pseudonocardia saturnea]